MNKVNATSNGFKCLLCGEEGGYDTIKLKTRNSDHHIVRCKVCGLQQLFPLPTVDEDKEHYDSNPHDRQTTPEFGIEELYKKFEYPNQYRVDYLEKDIGIQKDWKILDYGCGYGFLMEMLLKRGYDVKGCEISEDRLNVIRNRQGNLDRIYTFNLLETGTEIPKELEGRFDCVLSFHLIEHITSPVLFLKKLKGLIKPGGYLLMEMPNISNILMELSPEFNNYNYIRDHVAYYTPELMKSLCEKAGFTVILQKGVQIYGIMNNMNWAINGKPQLTAPSYVAPECIRWLEDYFKKKVNDDITSEFMYILAEKR